MILKYRKHILIEGRRRSSASFCILFSIYGREPQAHSDQKKGSRNSQENPEVLHERRNSSVKAHACRAEFGSYAARSSQKNP